MALHLQTLLLLFQIDDKFCLMFFKKLYQTISHLRESGSWVVGTMIRVFPSPSPPLYLEPDCDTAVKAVVLPSLA